MDPAGHAAAGRRRQLRGGEGVGAAGRAGAARMPEGVSGHPQRVRLAYRLPPTAYPEKRKGAGVLPLPLIPTAYRLPTAGGG